MFSVDVGSPVFSVDVGSPVFSVDIGSPVFSVDIVCLDCTRQMETREKGKPYCFAVGPLVDDGAIRTFFISCSKYNIW